ncbi:MAG: thioredoxin-dependent thiol peroxidase [Tissierellia bacterium]|nr:thioredoxin-dependent thiol peroxidase [Tissierellia bacterium]
MLNVSDLAPDFKLKNQDGKEVSLSDFRGQKVVLYFYPKDSTPGCTKQACGFRDINQELVDMGVKLLGISKDSLESHQRFSQKQGLNFDLLSDTEREVHQAYGVLVEKNMYGKMRLSTSRDTFIIDEEGKIEKIFRKVKAQDNPFDVLDYIKENLPK